jgi:hypothetical protein
VWSRLGLVGVTLLASALVFGALAGAIVLHRVATTPAASHQQVQTGGSGEQSNRQATPPKRLPTPEVDD